MKKKIFIISLFLMNLWTSKKTFRLFIVLVSLLKYHLEII